VENQQSIAQAPTAVNVTVRKRQRHRGPRDYLTEREIEKLMKAAGANRWGHRDATAILIAYRHGLRASELVALRWDDIELVQLSENDGLIYPNRREALLPWSSGKAWPWFR
jgi:integrase